MTRERRHLVAPAKTVAAPPARRRRRSDAAGRGEGWDAVPLSAGRALDDSTRTAMASFRHDSSDVRIVASGGAVSTIGRLAGAPAAGAAGGDVQKGSELGGAFGGLGDAALPVAAGRKVRADVRAAPSPVATAVSPDDVRIAYEANPKSVKKSLGNEWHQSVWERSGGTGPAPIAFAVEGTIRVNEERWAAVGDLSEINEPGEIGRAVPEAPQRGRLYSTAALADTGVAGEPAAPQPERPVESRETKSTPALRGAQRGRVTRGGYTPVLPEVAVEAYSLKPSSLSLSLSPEFHQQVWKSGGGKGKAPLAYRVNDGIRVDVENWPAELRAGIGL